jgi:L-lactate dehydrogenase complex protein LldG
MIMTQSSRDQILNRLRAAQRPFPNSKQPQDYLPVDVVADLSPAALKARFIREAEKVGCLVQQPATETQACETIVQLIGAGNSVSSWRPEYIPLAGLETALEQASITQVAQDAAVQVGLTGVDAALAATGSVVVLSGNGRYRAASLLPPIHIAVVRTTQIVANLETWWAEQRAQGLVQTRQASNIVVISGPSRTADIAMQLVLGMHGPRVLHLILLDDE